MIVSVVERQTWQRCRRKWQLTAESGEGLEPVHIAPALQLGSLIQSSLSEWTEHPDIDPLGFFFEESNNAILTVKEHYETNVGAYISDEELAPLYDTIALGRSMIENYVNHYKTPYPKDYKVIQTEQRLLVSIPNTEHWECVNNHILHDTFGIPGRKFGVVEDCPVCDTEVTWQPHFLRATMDTLLQHTRTGKLYPMERKTYERRPEHHKLLTDDQMLAYWWAVNQLYPDQVGGMLYDGLWKRAQPPKGRTFDDLFYRDIFIRPPAELEEFEDFLKKLIKDMVYSLQNDLIFINRRWEGCFDCGMEKLCDAMSRGEDVDYMREQYYKKRDFSTPQLIVSSVGDDD